MALSCLYSVSYKHRDVYKRQVITSNVSCLPEAGGNASMYIAPYDVQDLADKMRNLAGNAALANSMREKGWLHAQQFTTERAAAAVMQVYKYLVE